MVYCGPPSKGCKNCRTRKIRCDQKVPSCGQCTRKKTACTGYRSLLDLSFRDQSETVIRKAKAKERKDSSKLNDTKLAAASNPEPSTASSASSSLIKFPSSSFDSLDCLNVNRDVSLLTFTIQPTIEERSLSYFLSNFVASPTGPSHGHFSYVPDLLNEVGFEDTLKFSICAASLAGIANTSRSAQLMSAARRNYAIALQKINIALRTPTEAVKDSILLSIIIVAIFEATAGAKQLSLRGWTEHINGAATLVKLRGRAQLKTKIGFGLFIHATSHLLLSCMQREIPMPDQILELRKEAFNYVPSDPGWKFLEKSDECTSFRAAVKSGQVSEPETIIALALKFDRDLVQIFDNAPPGWMYETVHIDSDCPVVFGGSYDIYYDHWIAQIWNGARCVRIGMNELVRSQLAQGFNFVPPRFSTADHLAQFQTSTQTIIRMRDDIIRSVAQQVGFITRKPFQNLSRASTPPPVPIPPQQIFASGFDLGVEAPLSLSDLLSSSEFSFPDPDLNSLQPDPNFPSIGGYMLLWSVYVAGITRASLPAHRTFASNILTYIGETMGIRQGSNMAAFLQAHPVFQEKRKRLPSTLQDIVRWGKQAPIRPLREMFEFEGDGWEREVVRGGGEILARK